jgi:hypothetical protein
VGELYINRKWAGKKKLINLWNVKRIW